MTTEHPTGGPITAIDIARAEGCVWGLRRAAREAVLGVPSAAGEAFRERLNAFADALEKGIAPTEGDKS